MSKKKTLRAHPRLFVTKAHITNMKKPSGHPLVRESARAVAELADSFLESTTVDYPNSHNALLVRARYMQTRIVSLLAQWLRTGKPEYRTAALAHVEEIGRWEYWSWITWRENDPRPDAIFDLSYGENSATLAIAYDWLHGTLSDSEKALFIDIVRTRPFASYLNENKSHADFWYKHPESNWNTVCAGGAGMLALAMYDEVPEAKRVLAKTEKSIVPFMKTLVKNGGGWPEGIGYWGYGMRYAFMYLLSWENAIGKKHPLMSQAATNLTLNFPLDFMPDGVPASFGDVNSFEAMPFHYAAAMRHGRHDLIKALDNLWKIGGDPAERLRNPKGWPLAAGLLMLHPRRVAGKLPVEKNVARHYKNLDWFVLADRLPHPNMFLSIRGGTTEVPHGHMDLLSFHCVAGGEPMITNLSGTEYLDTTFGSRRYELFEMTPPAKNTILINGVGITRPSTVKSKRVSVSGFNGVRIDATRAMGTMRDGPVASFCGRLFIMLGNKAALIIDRVTCRHVARVETRMHTLKKLTVSGPSAIIEGDTQSLAIAYAASVPSIISTAVDAITTPAGCAYRKPGMMHSIVAAPSNTPAMIRLSSEGLHHAVTFVTALTPSDTPASLALSESGKTLSITIKVGRFSKRIVVSDRLEPIE